MNRGDLLPPLRTADVLVCELEDERLMYDLGSHKVACLNQWARLIAGRCDGVTTVGEMIDLIKGDGAEEHAELLINETLNQLARAGLLAESSSSPRQPIAPSRRSVLKAAASLGVSLPLVSWLVAPTAYAAVSNCIGSGAPCEVGGVPCCVGSTCVNTESGPTGFTCVPNVAPGPP